MQYIYLIQDGEAVKIGFSKDPKERLATLQAGNPRPLHLLCTMEGDESGEWLLQQLLLEHRIHGSLVYLLRGGNL